MHLDERHEGIDDGFSLDEFARVNLDFATWHPEVTFERCDVLVEADDRNLSRCGIDAYSPELGRVSAGALGPDAYQAIARACTLLEVEIGRRLACSESPHLEPVRSQAA